jgi:HSP20 family protein
MTSVETSQGFTKVQYKKKTSNLHYEQDIRNLQRRIHSPKVDLIERASYYLVRIELPGVDKETIKVNIKDNQIVFISGTKYSSNILETDKVIYRESKFDNFTRRVKLPSKVLRFNNRLDFHNGILNLSFDKRPQSEQLVEQSVDSVEQSVDSVEQLVDSVEQIDFKDLDKSTSWADM